jgi:MerR family transcriptional regulator/heat shock protein HspR
MSDGRPRYPISVAAELAGMHPQTLRVYEARGLVRPRRTPGGTRRYSERDLERLRRIALLTGELGVNLAGVERVLDLEETVERLRAEVTALEVRLEKLAKAARSDLADVHRSYRRELVLYQSPKVPERWNHHTT